MCIGSAPNALVTVVTEILDIVHLVRLTPPPPKKKLVTFRWLDLCPFDVQI